MVVIGKSHDSESDKSSETPTLDSSVELAAELSREREVTERLAELTVYQKEAAEQGITLKDHMSGAYSRDEGLIGTNAQALNRALETAGIERIPLRRLGIASAGTLHHSESEDLPLFTPEDKLNRTKFYLSLRGGARDDDSGIDAHLQQRFIKSIILSANSQGIDIALKTEEHAYDMPDIYTSQPEELKKVIALIYNSGIYPDSMWNDVPRVFQGNIGNGIPTSRIGMVQEPSTKVIGETVDIVRQAHSGRMGALGNAFEEHVRAGLGRREAFVAACAEIGVRPESPWLFSDAANEAFLKVAQASDTRS